MEKETIEFSDRYGGNYPDPETMCKGDCEGMGVVPVQADNEGYEEKWKQAEEISIAVDGWHFVTCNQCNGTGLKK